MNREHRDDKQNLFSRYAPYLSLGAEIAAGIAIPLLLGFWLDRWLDTSPWLLMVGIVAGMTNIFVMIYRLYKNLNGE